MLFDRLRKRMVEEQLAGRGIRDRRVLSAMATIPRHVFVDEALRERAYDDHPLPIGHGQTISHPYTVALMTEALELQGTERVLEIGTGSGYQTAVLARICANVFTIERIAALAGRARRVLDQLGLYNVALRVGDGTIGWNAEAPFDAIIVTAGTPQLPRPLLSQLRAGGRLVVPVGEEDSQTLMRLRVEADGVTEEYIGDCRFVKLLGRYGHAR
ncbi:MAG: protein-L-isoaspartate(D-aspartate) O-methyltransferase [Thermodesulfobacteriota bacterium]